MLPLITIGSYGSIASLPPIGVVRWAKTTENATDYSLQGTLKQTLYLPTSRTEKYKAKQAIDTFFVRLGDVCAAGLVLAGMHVFGFTTTEFALATSLLSVFWLLVVIALHQRPEYAGDDVADQSEAAAARATRRKARAREVQRFTWRRLCGCEPA